MKAEALRIRQKKHLSKRRLALIYRTVPNLDASRIHVAGHVPRGGTDKLTIEQLRTP